MAELAIREGVEILAELRVVRAHLEGIVTAFADEGIEAEQLVMVGLETCGDEKRVDEGLFTRFEGLVATLLLCERFCEVLVRGGSGGVGGKKRAMGGALEWVAG